MYDVAVIGGGPAGTSAAITAANGMSHGESRPRARVLLLEKGTFPRNKVCGEFVSAESLELLTSFLSGKAAILERAPRIRRARAFIGNQVLEIPIDPPAASISRIDLDDALWNAAQNHAVDVCQRETVLVVAGTGPFTLRTSGNEFMARSVIDATGRWSNLNRGRNGNGNGVVKWLGLKGHFSDKSFSDSVDLYFFEGGYCGVQPVDINCQKRVNACAMMRSDTGTSLEDCFRLHPELNKRSEGWQPITDAVATSPLLFHAPEPFREGIFRAGDAAAFVDPFIGDGISLALRSGVLAAKSLERFLQGHDSLKQAGEDYAAAYRRNFGPVFHASSKIRRLVELPAPVRAGILLFLASFPALTRYMVRKTR